MQPPSFEALGLVAFQISPHYLDPDPSSMHMERRRRNVSSSSSKKTKRPWLACARGLCFCIEGDVITRKDRTRPESSGAARRQLRCAGGDLRVLLDSTPGPVGAVPRAPGTL